MPANSPAGFIRPQRVGHHIANTSMTALIFGSRRDPAATGRQFRGVTGLADNAVIEVFDDVVADPLRDGMNPAGLFAGMPI